MNSKISQSDLNCEFSPICCIVQQQDTSTPDQQSRIHVQKVILLKLQAVACLMRAPTVFRKHIVVSV